MRDLVEGGGVPGDHQIEWTAAAAAIRRMVIARLFRPEPAVVEDLTQEALIRLMRIARTEDVRSGEATMRHVVHLVVLDHIRRIGRRLPMVPLDECDDVAERDGDRLMQRGAAAILRYFEENGLPHCCDRVHDILGGWSWSDVAARDGRKNETVRKEWSRCAEKVRCDFPEGIGLLAGWE